MNLNFNFDAKTLLSKWWTIVRDNFKEIETEIKTRVDEFNEKFGQLDANLNAERTERSNADTALGERISEETAASG